MGDSKILDSSSLAFDSSLEVFSSPASNLGVSSIKNLIYKPNNQFSAESSVRFHIPMSGATYLKLSDTKLQVKFRIVHGENNPITTVEQTSPNRSKRSATAEQSQQGQAGQAGQGKNAAETAGTAADSGQSKGSPNLSNSPQGLVAPVNCLFHALFDQVELILGNQTVSNVSGYSFKALANVLLDTSESVKNTKLKSALFEKDTGGSVNDANLSVVASNEGLKRRFERCKNSKVVTLHGSLDLDFFKQNRLLLNNIPLTLILNTTSNSFRLMSAEVPAQDYRIQILDYSLTLAHVQPTPTALLAHQEMLNDSKLVRYFYIKEDLRRYTVSSGSSSFFIQDMFQSRVPQRMLIYFVNSSAHSGSMGENPFYFHHHNVSEIRVTVNGETAPGGVITTDFDNDDFAEAYESIFNTRPQNRDGNEITNGITPYDYANGYFFAHINFQPQSFAGSFFPLRNDGAVRLELKFKRPLQQTIVLMALAYMGNHIECDFARNIFVSH